jgi:hypothetical protein
MKVFRIVGMPPNRARGGRLIGRVRSRDNCDLSQHRGRLSTAGTIRTSGCKKGRKSEKSKGQRRPLGQPMRSFALASLCRWPMHPIGRPILEALLARLHPRLWRRVPERSLHSVGSYLTLASGPTCQRPGCSESLAHKPVRVKGGQCYSA